MLLRESLATSSCHTTMIAHVSDEPARHAETLSTAQLAARIHRLRRRKAKVGAAPPPEGPEALWPLRADALRAGGAGRPAPRALPVGPGVTGCAHLALPGGGPDA